MSNKRGNSGNRLSVALLKYFAFNYPIQAFNYPLLTAVVQLNNLHSLRLDSCSNIVIHQLYRRNNL